jgi:sulfur carrier protein
MGPAPASPSPRSGPPLTLQVNGEQRSCAVGLTLEQVLVALGYNPRLVVVEYNGEILPRLHWAGRMVQESDCLEVVTIVGGGT